MKSNTSDLARVDLNLLVALQLLLQERSVRAAARRAGVTPSAMSHTLGRLRDLFGDELLVRSGRDMIPTARAEDLVEPVGRVLAMARELLEDAGPIDPAALRRPFRLVCTDHVSTVLLPAVEATLRRRAPGVDLFVQPLVPETMEDLRRGLVDAAIGVFPEAPPEMRARRLFDDAFVVVARPGHPRLGGSELSLPSFLAEDHVLVSPRGSPRGTVDEVLAAHGLARRVARTFPSFLSALWYVASSDDLLTISARLVAATAAAIPLRRYAPPVALPGYTLALVWHPRLDRSPEDAWFRGLLVGAAAALAPIPEADTGLQPSAGGPSSTIGDGVAPG